MCAERPKNRKMLQNMQKASIYEVNIRQYTVEGNFSAFQKHLPRLKEMGVTIIWLMPEEFILIQIID